MEFVRKSYEVPGPGSYYVPSAAMKEGKKIAVSLNTIHIAVIL